MEAMSRTGLRPGAFYPAYGLAESCVAVTLSPPGRGLVTERVSRDALADRGCPRAVVEDGEGGLECVSVGFPIAGSTVRIIDEAGQELPEGRLGQITVRGSSLMAGYLHDPKSTAEVLRGDALHTGDLGYMRGGELFIAGRIKDMLIVRGKNYFAEDIEAAAERVQGVRKGNAVAFGSYDAERGQDVLHVAVETRIRGEAARQKLKETLRKTISEEAGLTPADITLLRPGMIPKTSSGKKQRGACKEAVVTGSIFQRRKNPLAAAGWILLLSQLSRVWRMITRLFTSESPSSKLAFDRNR